MSSIGQISSPIFPENPEFVECLQDIPKEYLEECDIRYRNQYNFSQDGSIFYHQPTIYKRYSFVAAFDLDWTLAYNEFKLYPKDPDDIQILPHRRKYLEGLIKRGYTLAIFTNQSAVSAGEKQNKVERVKKFLKMLELPVWTFISTEKDMTEKSVKNTTRKPAVGMFELFKKIFSRKIDYLVYVGDALGRPQDFSNSDLEFGRAISARVYSPEEIFPGTSVPSFKKNKELVVFVGMPGSGKSRYYKEFLSSTHILISRDILKTKAKVLKELENVLTTGRSIAIDNTSPSQEDREVFYKLAQKYGYTIKVLYMLHNGTGYNDLRGEDRVPTIAYNLYFKNMVPPTEQNTPGELYKIWHVYEN